MPGAHEELRKCGLQRTAPKASTEPRGLQNPGSSGSDSKGDAEDPPQGRLSSLEAATLPRGKQEGGLGCVHLREAMYFRVEKGSFLCTLASLRIMKCLRYHKRGKAGKKGRLRMHEHCRLTTEGREDGGEIWSKYSGFLSKKQ